MKMKRQITNWEKLFANLSDKDLYPKYIQIALKFNTKNK